MSSTGPHRRPACAASATSRIPAPARPPAIGSRTSARPGTGRGPVWPDDRDAGQRAGDGRADRRQPHRRPEQPAPVDRGGEQPGRGRAAERERPEAAQRDEQHAGQRPGSATAPASSEAFGADRPEDRAQLVVEHAADDQDEQQGEVEVAERLAAFPVRGLGPAHPGADRPDVDRRDVTARPVRLRDSIVVISVPEFSANWSSWLAIRIEPPVFRYSLSSSATSSRPSRSRRCSGSSRISSELGRSRVRARVRRCFCPEDSDGGIASRCAARPKRSSASSMPAVVRVLAVRAADQLGVLAGGQAGIPGGRLDGGDHGPPEVRCGAGEAAEHPDPARVGAVAGWRRSAAGWTCRCRSRR